MNKNYFYLILITLFTSCQSVKDGLSGKKFENSDEFLVIKKNPLVLPPDFNKLPVPKEVSENSQVENIENEIESLLGSIKDSNETIESSENTETENYVLEKIKD
mgnify:FL=1